MTRFWWIRHGPIPGVPTLCGRMDVPCDLSDAARLTLLRQRLPAGAVVAASPLGRAAATAWAVMEREPDCLEEDFLEQDFGAWSSSTWAEVAAWPEAAAFWKDPAHARCPGGESFADQVRRVAGAIGRFSALHPQRDVLCFCHAGTVRAALALALRLSDMALNSALSFVVSPLSLTRIDAVGEDFRIECVNEGGCS